MKYVYPHECEVLNMFVSVIHDVAQLHTMHNRI